MNKKIPEKKIPFQALSHHEVGVLNQALNGTLNEHRNRAIIFLALGAGLQLNEICGLRISEVLSNGRVPKVIRISEDGSASRQIYLTSQARQYLEKYLSFLNPETKSQPLFHSPANENERIPAQSMSIMLTRLSKTLNLPSLSFNTLRKTHAAGLRKMGIDRDIIKGQLGMKTNKALEKYIDVGPEKDGLAIEYLRF